MHPKTFYESNSTRPQSGKCFVLMPFADEFDEVYETIREAMESTEISFVCRRADDIRGGGHIMESVLKEIGESEIVIADLTGRNPNVFYELGIAHMVKPVEKVILLIQDITTMPFDLDPFRSIAYRQSIAGARQLKIDLQNAVKEVADIIKLRGDGNSTIYQFNVGDKRLFQFPVQLFGEHNCLYDFEIFGDYIGDDGVKFMLSMTKYAAGQLPSKEGPRGYGMSLTNSIDMPNIPWILKINKLSGRIASFHLVHK